MAFAISKREASSRFCCSPKRRSSILVIKILLVIISNRPPVRLSYLINVLPRTFRSHWASLQLSFRLMKRKKKNLYRWIWCSYIYHHVGIIKSKWYSIVLSSSARNEVEMCDEMQLTLNHIIKIRKIKLWSKLYTIRAGTLNSGLHLSMQSFSRFRDKIEVSQLTFHLARLGFEKSLKRTSRTFDQFSYVTFIWRYFTNDTAGWLGRVWKNSLHVTLNKNLIILWGCGLLSLALSLFLLPSPSERHPENPFEDVHWRSRFNIPSQILMFS